VNPAHDRGVRQIDPALCHHRDQISEAEFEPKIPPHTESDDFPVEMAALEEVINAQHVAQPSSRRTVSENMPRIRYLHQNPQQRSRDGRSSARPSRWARGVESCSTWVLDGRIRAQLAALKSPLLFRRVILAGTGPGGGERYVPGGPDIRPIASRPILGLEEQLFLFFTTSEKSRGAGEAYWQRLKSRVGEIEAPVSQEGINAQLQALVAWGGGDSAYNHLAEIKQPVLVANGSNDMMVPTINSFTMSQLRPNAQLDHLSGLRPRVSLPVPGSVRRPRAAFPIADANSGEQPNRTPFATVADRRIAGPVARLTELSVNIPGRAGGFSLRAAQSGCLGSLTRPQ